MICMEKPDLVHFGGWLSYGDKVPNQWQLVRIQVPSEGIKGEPFLSLVKHPHTYYIPLRNGNTAFILQILHGLLSVPLYAVLCRYPP
jgi:hypothetical protein